MATSREIKKELAILRRQKNPDPGPIRRLEEALYWTEGKEEDERQLKVGRRKLETAGIYRRRRKRRKKR